jgi:hypothetical protein
VKNIAALVWLELFTRRRRVAALVAFGALYLVAAVAVRMIGMGEHGQVEPDALMAVGGYPLMSAFLLTGWSIGRYPLIIILALTAGLFSADARAGYTRLYAATRVRLLTLYGFRLALLMILAFVMSVVLIPIFDIIVLGKPSGPQLLLLVASYILVFGSLTALFSVFTRADAWCTVFVAIAAMVWHAMNRGGLLDRVPQAITQIVSAILPPQGALSSIENAFGSGQPAAWGAFLYVCMYAALVLLVAGLALSRRDI